MLMHMGLDSCKTLEFILLYQHNIYTCGCGGACKFRRLVYSRVCAIKICGKYTKTNRRNWRETELLTLIHFHLLNVTVFNLITMLLGVDVD